MGGFWNEAVIAAQQGAGEVAPYVLGGLAGSLRAGAGMGAAATQAPLRTLATQQAGRLGVAGAGEVINTMGGAYLDLQTRIQEADARGDTKHAAELRAGRDAYVLALGLTNGVIERFSPLHKMFPGGKPGLGNLTKDLLKQAAEGPMAGITDRGLLHPQLLKENPDVLAPILQEAVTGTLGAAGYKLGQMGLDQAIRPGDSLAPATSVPKLISPPVYSTSQPPGETIAASTSASRFPVQDKMKLAEQGYPAEGVEKYVLDNYDSAKYKDLGGPDTVWLVIHSTSGRNTIPQVFADKLASDHGGTIVQSGISLFQADQAKTKRGYKAKMENSAKTTIDSPTLISSLKGKIVVIADDIMTSGLTTEALADALASHGIKVEAVAVLAAVKGGEAANSSQLTNLQKSLQQRQPPPCKKWKKKLISYIKILAESSSLKQSSRHVRSQPAQ